MADGSNFDPQSLRLNLQELMRQREIETLSLLNDAEGPLSGMSFSRRFGTSQCLAEQAGPAASSDVKPLLPQERTRPSELTVRPRTPPSSVPTFLDLLSRQNDQNNSPRGPRAPPSASVPTAAGIREWLNSIQESAEKGKSNESPARERLRDQPTPRPTSLNNRSLPDLTPFQGPIKFHVEPPDDELETGRQISRSAPWTYDSGNRTLYVKPSKSCPMRIHLEEDLPPDAVFHATFAFEEAEHFLEPVVRCANHREQLAKSAFGRYEHHFAMSDNPAANHLVDMKGRPFIMIPYSEKKHGIHTESFQFTCYSSSCTPFKRKTLKMIICILNDGNILARDVLYLRVCACPGRDRKSLLLKQEQGQDGQRRKRSHAEMEAPDDEDEVFQIKRTVRGYKNFVLVTKMIDTMESLVNGGERPTTPEKNDGSPQSHSDESTHS